MDHPDVEQLGRLAGHGEDSQERFYDDMRQRIGSMFVKRHSGLLQSLTAMSETPQGATPPSTELRPVSGE